MSTEHLTEEDLQVYALGKLPDAERIKEHLLVCEQCSREMQVYKLLFSGIQQLDSPKFDFDVSAAVLGQLPVAIKKRPSEKYLYGVLTLSLIFLLTGILYFFGRTLLSLFTGLTSYAIYLTLIVIMVISISAGIDLYKQYEQKIKSIGS